MIPAKIIRNKITTMPALIIPCHHDNNSEKKKSEFVLKWHAVAPPPAAARLAEAEPTEEVVSSEVMDPPWLSHPGLTCRPFFMQMCWHATRMAAVKITCSEEERRREGDGS